MRSFAIFCLLAAVAVATPSRVLKPAESGARQLRFRARMGSRTPGGGCPALTSCGSCTAISFCMWHKSGFCQADTDVKGTEVYNFYKGSCTTLAGDWSEVGEGVGAGAPLAPQLQEKMEGKRADDSYVYHPLMMQPPAIANEDEAHIFQGPYPKPDYGMGELGYKLQGLDANMNREKEADSDPMNTPRHRCRGDPLEGCLQKPVIVPQGAYVHPSKFGPKHPVEMNDEQFRQIPSAAKEGYTKPVWNEDYNDKDDLDKDE